MTEKLYYTEPYRTQLEVLIEDISPYEKGWALQFDRTILYPEGGGQPGDRGMIADISIVDTIKVEKQILHLCREQPSFKKGERALLTLDWDHRFDYMQQHTGQHILSGVLYRELGIGTVSVHQGEEYTTIETDAGEISVEQIELLERKANEHICENHAIFTDTKNEQEVAALELRRRPKVSGSIRLVCIDSCDIAACGGVHTKSTGEVGLIKCIGQETIRSSIRLIFKIGQRAYVDYRIKDTAARELTGLLSCRTEGIVEACTALSENLKGAKSDYQHLLGLYASLQLDKALLSARHIGRISVLTLELSTEQPAGLLKQIAKVLPPLEEYALCAVQHQSDGSLQWLICTSSQELLSLDSIRRELFPIIDAKGGGKPPVYQGMGRDASRVSELFTSFERLLG